jgi:hypothetical protein
MVVLLCQVAVDPRLSKTATTGSGGFFHGCGNQIHFGISLNFALH